VYLTQQNSRMLVKKKFGDNVLQESFASEFCQLFHVSLPCAIIATIPINASHPHKPTQTHASCFLDDTLKQLNIRFYSVKRQAYPIRHICCYNNND